MRILWRIKRVTLNGRERSDDIRRGLGVENIRWNSQWTAKDTGKLKNNSEMDGHLLSRHDQVSLGCNILVRRNINRNVQNRRCGRKRLLDSLPFEFEKLSMIVFTKLNTDLTTMYNHSKSLFMSRFIDDVSLKNRFCRASFELDGLQIEAARNRTPLCCIYRGTASDCRHWLAPLCRTTLPSRHFASDDWYVWS